MAQTKKKPATRRVIYVEKARRRPAARTVVYAAPRKRMQTQKKSRYVKSMYVEIFAIMLIVLYALSIVACATGFFLAKDIADGLVKKGIATASAVYPTIFTVLGALTFYFE